MKSIELDGHTSKHGKIVAIFGLKSKYTEQFDNAWQLTNSEVAYR